MPVMYSALRPTGEWKPGRREHEEALRADDLRRGLQQYLAETRMAQQANQFGQEMEFRKMAESNAGDRFRTGLEQSKELTEKGWEKNAELAGLTRKHQTELQGQNQDFMRDRWSVEDKRREAKEPSLYDKFISGVSKIYGLREQGLRTQMLQKQLETMGQKQPAIDALEAGTRRLITGQTTLEDEVELNPELEKYLRNVVTPQQKAATEQAAKSVSEQLDTAPINAPTTQVGARLGNYVNAREVLGRPWGSGEQASFELSQHADLVRNRPDLVVGQAAPSIRAFYQSGWPRAKAGGATKKQYADELISSGVIDMLASRPEFMADTPEKQAMAVKTLIAILRRWASDKSKR